MIKGVQSGAWREFLDVRNTLNSLPRFSLMLPYFTRKSVVGVKAGTESGITRADLNLLRTSAARAVMMPDVGHVCCRSVRRGLPYTADVAERRDTMNVFISMVEDVSLMSRFQIGSNSRRDLLVYIHAYFNEL